MEALNIQINHQILLVTVGVILWIALYKQIKECKTHNDWKPSLRTQKTSALIAAWLCMPAMPVIITIGLLLDAIQRTNQTAKLIAFMWKLATYRYESPYNNPNEGEK